MSITNTRKPRWSFYPAWVALNTISIPIAFAIYWILISLIKNAVGDAIMVGGNRHITEDYLVPYVLYPAIGLVTGFLQYLLLRRHLPRIGWWIAATTLGVLLGFIGRRVIYLTIYDTLDVNAIWFETLMTALAGGVMGLAQWLVMHQRVRNAGLWIPANLLSWGIVGWGAVTTSNQIVIPAVVIVLVPGIATSITLWLLLDLLPQREFDGRNTPSSNVLEGNRQASNFILWRSRNHKDC